jgi:hypothetical protein
MRPVYRLGQAHIGITGTRNTSRGARIRSQAAMNRFAPTQPLPGHRRDFRVMAVRAADHLRHQPPIQRASHQLTTVSSRNLRIGSMNGVPINGSYATERAKTRTLDSNQPLTAPRPSRDGMGLSPTKSPEYTHAEEPGRFTCLIAVSRFRTEALRQVTPPAH